MKLFCWYLYFFGFSFLKFSFSSGIVFFKMFFHLIMAEVLSLSYPSVFAFYHVCFCVLGVMFSGALIPVMSKGKEWDLNI